MFAEMFHSRGGLYWSRSGGSTNPDANKNFSSANAVPITMDDMRKIRAGMSELCIDHGAADGSSVVVNLFIAGKGSRSLEVFTEVFANLNSTVFPLETRCSDEYIVRQINYWGATVIVGLTTRSVKLDIFCQREDVRLTTLQSIFHGGANGGRETTSGSGRRVQARCRRFELYGSSEVGVFSMRPAGHTYFETISDCIVLETLDEEHQAVPEGRMGRLVVTNVARKWFAQIRFDTGDIGCLADMKNNNGKTFFRLKGRDPNTIKRQYGDLTIKWVDILRGEIGQYLYKTFDGCCLFQIVVEKDIEENGNIRGEAVLGEEQVRTKCATLLTYAKKIANKERVAVEKTLLNFMHNLFTAKARGWHVAVHWNADGLELHRVEGYQKLKTFA